MEIKSSFRTKWKFIYILDVAGGRKVTVVGESGVNDVIGLWT